MKKRFIFIIALFLLAVSTPSYALVNWGESDLYQQLKRVFNNSSANTDTPSQISGFTATNDVTFRTSLIAAGRVNGASTVASSSTNLLPANLPYVLLRKFVSGGGGLDTTPGTTLQNGTIGQVLVLQIAGLMAGGTWVLTPTTKTGFTSITFDTKGDTVTLLYVDNTIGWIVVANGGAVINQNT